MAVSILLCLLASVFADDGWRIVGGLRAEKSQFPYFVSLQTFGKHVCGGAILDENTIITAAHCFKNNYFPHTWTVVVGSPGLYKAVPAKLKYSVSQILDHRGYDKRKIGTNDIAIMKTKEKIVFNDQVQPVKPADKDDRPPPGTACKAMGYGWTDPRAWMASDRLMTIGMNVQPHKYCYQQYFKRLTAEHICAGGDTPGGVCSGDSGGPLICPVRGEPRLYGVASFTRNPCGDTDSPGVFARVGFFHTWLQDKLNKKGDVVEGKEATGFMNNLINNIDKLRGK